MFARLFKVLFKRPTARMEDSFSKPVGNYPNEADVTVNEVPDVIGTAKETVGTMPEETVIPVDSLSVEDLLASFAKLSYEHEDASSGKLNLVGIRNTEDKDANTFNDRLYYWYYKDGAPVLRHCAITTDPGVYYRYSSMVEAGTAIVVPGQYMNVWKVGKHQGKYTALVQNKPITVYRDADRNGTIDIDFSKIVSSGFFGINLHRASATGTSNQVDKWSAGCQVVASNEEYAKLIDLIERKFRYDSFNYTLLRQDQLVRAPK